jgi:hypothetical protein
MLHHIIKIAISVDLDTHAHSAALLTLTIADMSFLTHSARVYCHGPDHFTPEGKTLITHRSLIDTMQTHPTSDRLLPSPHGTHLTPARTLCVAGVAEHSTTAWPCHFLRR